MPSALRPLPPSEYCEVCGLKLLPSFRMRLTSFLGHQEPRSRDMHPGCFRSWAREHLGLFDQYEIAEKADAQV